MKKMYYVVLACLWSIGVQAQEDTSLWKENYHKAYHDLKGMLEGKAPLNFERAIFIAENAYWDHTLSYDLFQRKIDQHIDLIQGFIDANDQSEQIDFDVKLDPNKPLDLSKIKYLPSEKKAMYKKALANWAIYTYMTDTVQYATYRHLPFQYDYNDPFGQKDWINSQVLSLLTRSEKKGNCFALTSLFKIFSDRFNSGAAINTAPGHIYIQHQDHKGDWYNVELATGTHPSDGSIQTLTFTYIEAIRSGVALRRLTPKQEVALCLVYLAKSYEHKLGTKTDDFLMQCATLALQHDPNNLNAHLLKHQVLAERVINYAQRNQITEVERLSTNPKIQATFHTLEQQTVLLFDLGYHQMPMDMQQMILAGLKRADRKPIYVEDKTPSPFTSIEVDEEDKRYSTLSGGLFEELHPIRRYENYSYFVLDTEKRKLTKMKVGHNNQLLIDPVAFAWSIDPLAHEFPSWSPYAAFENNPIRNIDPDGRAAISTTGDNDDTYGVDVDGNVRHIDDKKYYDRNGNEVDRLYALDGNNNIVKSKGYAESRIQEGSSILNELSHSGESKAYADFDGSLMVRANKYLAYGGGNQGKEMQGLFTFLANNSNVEWSLGKFSGANGKTGYQIGTYGLNDKNYITPYAPGLSSKLGTPLNLIHSHPFSESYNDIKSGLDGDARVGTKYYNKGMKSYEIYFPRNNQTWRIGRDGSKIENVKRTKF